MIGMTRNLVGGSINPSYGFAVNFTMLMDQGKAHALDWIWLYCGMPFAGSLMALVFYEFVFKVALKNVEEDEDGDDNLLQD